MTAAAPIISVVLPAYNREASIARAIESVLRQSWRDLELIVVDDASTDATLDRARSIRDPRVRVLTSPRNSGPSAARNLGLAEARGEWVAFQDSDDEWLPGKLDQQMTRLQERDMRDVAAYCGMLICARNVPGHRGRTAPRYHPAPEVTGLEGDLSKALLWRSLISTQTLMARRDALTRIRGFDTSLSALEDWDCALRLSDLGGFAFVDMPLVMQHFSANSLTRKMPLWATARARIIDKHQRRFAAHPDCLAQQWRTLAGARRRLGETEGARAALQRATALRPFDPSLRGLQVMLALGGKSARTSMAKRTAETGARGPI